MCVDPLYHLIEKLDGSVTVQPEAGIKFLASLEQ